MNTHERMGSEEEGCSGVNMNVTRSELSDNEETMQGLIGLAEELLGDLADSELARSAADALHTPPIPTTPPQPMDDVAPPPYDEVDFHLPLDDEAPPPYEDFVSVSSLSPGNRSAASDDDAAPPSRSPSPAPLVRRAWSNVQMNSGRLRATAMTHQVLQIFAMQSHVAVDHALMLRMYVQIPVVDRNPVVLPMIVCAIQTLGQTDGAEYILRAWSAREGRVIPPSYYPLFDHPPPITPWDAPDYWNYDSWAASLSLVQRFLAQSTPLPEMAFLDTLEDIYRSTGTNGWIVDIMVLVLYAVYRSSWSWPAVFRR